MVVEKLKIFRKIIQAKNKGKNSLAIARELAIDEQMVKEVIYLYTKSSANKVYA